VTNEAENQSYQRLKIGEDSRKRVALKTGFYGLMWGQGFDRRKFDNPDDGIDIWYGKGFYLVKISAKQKRSEVSSVCNQLKDAFLLLPITARCKTITLERESDDARGPEKAHQSFAARSPLLLHRRQKLYAPLFGPHDIRVSCHKAMRLALTSEVMSAS
jgi:hypothetical protein